MFLFALLSLSHSFTWALYVDSQGTSPKPTGSVESPFADLTQALLSTTDPQITILLPELVSGESYALQTLGLHAEVDLNCSGNGLTALNTIVVNPGTVLKLGKCHVGSSVSAGVLLVVLGAVEIEGGSVHNVLVKGFALYGSLQARDVLFVGNADSILAVQSFGFELVLERCKFQGNTSPVGAVLLLGLSGTSSNSTTLVRVVDCIFVGNGAYLGGSFMYLGVNPDLQFSPTQLNETRLISVQGNRFQSNPGYLCILYPKFLNITFHSNVYENHQYGFLIKQLGGAITLSNSSVHTVNRFVILTYLVGEIQLHSLNITHVTEGPAILLMNSAPQSLGIAYLNNIRIHNFTLLNRVLYSATIFAFSVHVAVSDLYVSEGDSYGCALGCYFFSSAEITMASMDKVVVEQGATVAFIGANAEVNGLRMTNSTLTEASYSALFLSSVTFRNMDFAPGIGSYTQNKETATNMVASFDSFLVVKGGFYDLPPAKSFVAFYLWLSYGEVHNVTFPRMHSNLVDVYYGSCYIRNVTINAGRDVEFLAFLSFHANLTLEDVRLKDIVMIALFSALSNSTITANRMSISNITFQSVGIVSKSVLDITDISLLNVQADTLFWYSSSSFVRATRLVAVDSTFDLTQLIAGTLVLRESVFQRIRVRRRFITAQKGTVIFENSELNGLFATFVTPFAQLFLGSSLTFKNSRITNLRSREQGLISAHDSTLTVDNSLISDFNVTFFRGLRCSIQIYDSEVTEGRLKDERGQLTAGLLDCLDCLVHFRDSSFRGITGRYGGVVSLVSKLKQAKIGIENCVFEDCSAAKDGGVIHAIASTVSISLTTFQNNSADRGAGLYFECSDSSQCSSAVTSSQFTNNSAREGAGVKWTLVRPYFSNNTSAYNKAVYGEFEASIPTHMVLANSIDSVISGVPGVIVVQPILVAFLDTIDQVVATDYSSTAVIQTTQIIGATYLMVKEGVANFSGVIVQTTPGTTVSTIVFSPTINSTFPNSLDSTYSFDYHTRLCLPGEVSSSKGCYLCPKNTFSVDPLDSDCRECPSYATCPGGSALLLDQGYWRLSELSSTVYKCPIPRACLGGQSSTCAEGYRDRLCSRCAEGYYMAGLTYCIKCENLPIRITRISVFLSFLLVLFILVIRKSTSDPSLRSVIVLTTLRILFNFLQSVLMISLINVDWRAVTMGLFSANEMFVSLALSSFTVECFECKSYVDGDFRPVILKAIIASILPIAVVILNLVLYSVLKRGKQALYRGFQASLVLLYSIHPYIVKAGVTLISCKAIESDTLWLTADVSLECWQKDHLQHVLTLFIPLFVIYILGIPMLLLISISRFRKSQMHGLVTYFTIGYRRNAGIWEGVICLRKMFLILVLGLLGSSDSLIQILFAMVVLYLFLEWHIREKPFDRPFHNKLEGFSIFLQLLLTAFSFYFIPSLNIREIVLSIISYTILTLVLGFILISVGTTIAQIFVYRNQKTVVMPALRRSESPVSLVLPVPPPSHNSSVMGLVSRKDEVSLERQ